MSNRETFLRTYKEELNKEVLKKPEDYNWPISQVNEIAEKMTNSLAKGTANKDSNAIRRTCKYLNIKYTYDAIRTYLLK